MTDGKNQIEAKASPPTAKDIVLDHQCDLAVNEDIVEGLSKAASRVVEKHGITAADALVALLGGAMRLVLSSEAEGSRELPGFLSKAFLAHMDAPEDMSDEQRASDPWLKALDADLAASAETFSAAVKGLEEEVKAKSAERARALALALSKAMEEVGVDVSGMDARFEEAFGIPLKKPSPVS